MTFFQCCDCRSSYFYSFLKKKIKILSGHLWTVPKLKASWFFRAQIPSDGFIGLTHSIQGLRWSSFHSNASLARQRPVVKLNMAETRTGEETMIWLKQSFKSQKVLAGKSYVRNPSGLCVLEALQKADQWPPVFGVAAGASVDLWIYS